MEQKDKQQKNVSCLPYETIRLWTVMLSTFLVGFLAHGTAFFQKLSVLDDVFCLFDTGATYTSGRWFLGILTDGLSFLYQSSHYSTPLLHGGVTLGCIGLASYITVLLLEIRNLKSCALIGGLMTAFPVVASLLGYMFTAPFYGLALCMTVLGVWVICKRRRYFLGGVALIACACGIYQAYLPTAVCLLLMEYIRALSSGTEKKPVKEAVRLGLACVLSVILYYVIARVFLAARGEVLDSYGGISNMGQEGLAVYFRRAKLALLLFLLPGKGSPGTAMYPQAVGWLYPVALMLIAFFSVGLLKKTWQRDRRSALLLLLALGAFPFAVNFIYIMCPTVHSLMVYAQVMPLVFLCTLADWTFAEKPSKNGLPRNGALVLALLCMLLYVRLDNAVYLRAEIYQQRMIQYYTTLITQIKSMPEYTDDTPVALVNGKALRDETFRDLTGFEDVPPYLPVAYQSSATAYPETFMEVWCGFAPPKADSAALEQLPEVQEMPHYPDAGAIRWIDGVIVVKF